MNNIEVSKFPSCFPSFPAGAACWGAAQVVQGSLLLIDLIVLQISGPSSLAEAAAAAWAEQHCSDKGSTYWTTCMAVAAFSCSSSLQGKLPFRAKLGAKKSNTIYHIIRWN